MEAAAEGMCRRERARAGEAAWVGVASGGDRAGVGRGLRQVRVALLLPARPPAAEPAAVAARAEMLQRGLGAERGNG